MKKLQVSSNTIMFNPFYVIQAELWHILNEAKRK